ncbi:MAG: AIR synthase family protein [Thermoplasmata archaeon]
MSKLDLKFLEELIFEQELRDESVIMGPRYGEDSAVVKVGGDHLVIHPDPISGAVDNIGWLSIHIPANDVAVSGAVPRWSLPTVQLPQDLEEEKIRAIFKDLFSAASELNISVIGGHTERVRGIDRPLINNTMIGVTKKPIFTSGSQPGDKIVQINEGGIEGSWIIASDFYEICIDRGISEDTIQRIQGWKDDISVVEDALKIKEKVTSMHDPTEGGVLQGLYEMAHASGNRFVIDKGIEVREETRVLCEKLGLDPLRLISSGCLLATVQEGVDIEGGRTIGCVESVEPGLDYDGEEVEEIVEDELFRFIDSCDS